MTFISVRHAFTGSSQPVYKSSVACVSVHLSSFIWKFNNGKWWWGRACAKRHGGSGWRMVWETDGLSVGCCCCRRGFVACVTRYSPLDLADVRRCRTLRPKSDWSKVLSCLVVTGVRRVTSASGPAATSVSLWFADPELVLSDRTRAIQLRKFYSATIWRPAVHVASQRQMIAPHVNTVDRNVYSSRLSYKRSEENH